LFRENLFTIKYYTKMKPKVLLATLAIVSVALITACKHDDFKEVVGVCPLVITTVPVNGASGVPLNQIVTATFSKKMRAATITDASFTVETSAKGTMAVAGTVTYVDSTATFTPSSPLTPSTAYTGTIKKSVKDLTGNAMQADYVWAFTTGLNTYTLNVTQVNGTVAKVPDLVLYNSGVTVQLTASPNAGYSFTSWSGDATGSVNPLTVTMTANKNITANFTINAFTLNVTAVNGTVVKSPLQATYNFGTIVNMTAAPNAGYVFTSWSGDAVGVISPKSILMNANKNVTANFSLLASVCPTIVNLGLSGDFVILAESGISTTGVTSVTGNMGINPSAATAITGFGLILPAGGAFSTSSLVIGNIYAPSYAAPTPADLVTSVNDMHTAYTTANGLVVPAPVNELLAGNLNGQTLTKGIYKWSSGVSITNSLILDGGGDNCATFIFQIAQNLTVANSTVITLQNGAQAKNIFWVVAGSGAVLGTNSDFSGNILSKTLISLNTGAKVLGRLMAQTAVTLNASTVILP
jgi:uncharacterized repeat protein (TIGR02543 family)